MKCRDYHVGRLFICLTFGRCGRQPPLLPTVTGLRWGEYVGSPECAAPGAVWQRPLAAPVARLEPVPAAGTVLAVPPRTCCTHTWREQHRHGSLAPPAPVADQLSCANWGQPDGLVRLRHGHRMQPIVAPPPGDQVNYRRASVPTGGPVEPCTSQLTWRYIPLLEFIEVRYIFATDNLVSQMHTMYNQNYACGFAVAAFWSGRFNILQVSVY